VRKGQYSIANAEGRADRVDYRQRGVSSSEPQEHIRVRLDPAAWTGSPDHLAPGGTCGGWIEQYSNQQGKFVNTGCPALVYDWIEKSDDGIEHGRTFGLKGERINCVWDPSTSTVTTVGAEQGLTRQGRLLSTQNMTVMIVTKDEQGADIDSNVQVTVDAFTCTDNLEDDADVIIEFLPDHNKWVLLYACPPGLGGGDIGGRGTVALVELKDDSLLPGTSGTFYQLTERTDGNCGYEDPVLGVTPEITVSDPARSNFMVKTNRAWAVRGNNDGQGNRCWYLVGENGLRQKGIYNGPGELACNGTGTVDIWSPSTCGGQTNLVPAGVQVSGCASWGNRRRIYPGEQVWVQYDSRANIWHIEEDETVTHCVGVLQTDMCNDANTANVNEIEFKNRFGNGDCSVGSAVSITASNPYKLAGRVGAKVELRRDVKVADENSWEIIQVEHERRVVTSQIYFNGCDVRSIITPVLTMACEADGPQDIVMEQGTQVNVITDIYRADGDDDENGGVGPDECKLRAKMAQLCVMDYNEAPDIDLISFIKQEVISDIIETGQNQNGDPTALTAFLTELFVPCIGGSSTKPLLEFTDCEPDPTIPNPVEPTP